VDYNFADQKISVSLGAEKYKASEELPLLTDVLNTVDHLAGESNRHTLIVIDEFQQIIREGGETAERQIRSVVQRHRNTAYVFAGSKARFLPHGCIGPRRPDSDASTAPAATLEGIQLIAP
jgi:hypothetical protein